MVTIIIKDSHINNQTFLKSDIKLIKIYYIGYIHDSNTEISQIKVILEWEKTFKFRYNRHFHHLQTKLVIEMQENRGCIYVIWCAIVSRSTTKNHKNSKLDKVHLRYDISNINIIIIEEIFVCPGILISPTGIAATVCGVIWYSSTSDT